MKKQIILLSALALIGLTSCINENTSASGSSFTQESTSSSLSSEESKESLSSISSEEKKLPTTLEQIKANISATEFNGYTFEEKGKNVASGTVSFQENELKAQGTSTYDGITSDLFIYMGYDASLFYSIKNDSGKQAKKYNIVESVSNNKIQITKENAVAQIKAYRYNSMWFTDAVLELFKEGNTTTFKTEEKAEGYIVTLSETLSERTTKDVTLNFNENNNLVSGTYKSSKWDSDNWDSEKNAPIDSDQNPSSYELYNVELNLGKVVTGVTLSFDVQPYYVTKINEFYVSSYSDKKANNGKALAGDYVNLDVKSFAPSTAYDGDDLKIISSSDQSIIEVSSLFSARALKAGKCTLTIGNEFGNVTATIEMIVSSPSINSIYLYAGMKGYSSGYTATIAPEEEAKLQIEFYPSSAEGELEGISSDTSVVSIVGVANNKSYLTVKGVAEGTAEITVRVKDSNPVIENTRKVTITVKKKETESDASWLVGTWKAYNEVDNLDEDTFTTTFKFLSDHTGNVSQKVAGIAAPNSATFEWSYTESEGLKLTSWVTEEYTIKQPTKIVISDDKKTLSITASCQGYEDHSTITMALTKEDPSTSLVGTWTGSITGATATFKLQPNKTGTLLISLDEDLDDTASFTWDYDGTNFTLKITDQDYINSISITVANATKLTAKINYDDVEGDPVNGTFTLTKQ